MRIVLVLAVICLCTLYLCSCSGNDSVIGYSFSQADFGTTQPLKVGQLIYLAVPQNPSTGFTWHDSAAPAGLLNFVRDYYVATQPVMPGSGGKQYFVWTVQKPGTCVITMQSGRWGTSEPPLPAQKITLTITN
jgi:inhibitor of cysteine peptidase